VVEKNFNQNLSFFVKLNIFVQFKTLICFKRNNSINKTISLYFKLCVRRRIKWLKVGVPNTIGNFFWSVENEFAFLMLMALCGQGISFQGRTQQGCPVNRLTSNFRNLIYRKSVGDRFVLQYRLLGELLYVYRPQMFHLHI